MLLDQPRLPVSMVKGDDRASHHFSTLVNRDDSYITVSYVGSLSMRQIPSSTSFEAMTFTFFYLFLYYVVSLFSCATATLKGLAPRGTMAVNFCHYYSGPDTSVFTIVTDRPTAADAKFARVISLYCEAQGMFLIPFSPRDKKELPPGVHHLGLHGISNDLGTGPEGYISCIYEALECLRWGDQEEIRPCVRTHTW